MTETNNRAAYVDLAFNILTSAARENPNTFHEQMTRCIKTNPKGAQALLNALRVAGHEINGSVTQKPFSPPTHAPEFGGLVKGKGIYMGCSADMFFYSASDFLRDKSDQPVSLTFEEARDELTALNRRAYGRGTEPDLRKAMISGDYREGDLFLPFSEFLNGINEQGRMMRAATVFHLHNRPAFTKIKQTAENGPVCNRWVLSGTMAYSNRPVAICVNILDGTGSAFSTDTPRFRVLPFRAFKRLAL